MNDTESMDVDSIEEREQKQILPLLLALTGTVTSTFTGEASYKQRLQ